MTHLLAILITALASFIWLFLFRVIDFFHKEPWLPLLFFFFLGGTSVLVPLYLHDLIELVPYENEILHAFINIALIEEGGKLFAVLIGFLFFRKHLDDEPDWLIYGAAAGLGFGAVENVLYAIRYGDIVLHFREIITLSGHAFDTGILVYGVYVLFGKNEAKGLLWLVFGVSSHALYDAFLTMGEAFPIYTPMAFGIYLVSIEIFSLLLNNAVNHSRHFEEKLAMPARAIRSVMTATFAFMAFVFLGIYIKEYGFAGIGIFLFFSAPLIALIYVTINRLTSLVLVRKKSFPVIPTFPFQYIGMDLGPSSTMSRFIIRGLPYDEWDFVSYIGETTEIRPVNRNYDYFGDSADIEFTGKVYAKSQILFYPVRFVRSDDPIHEDKHFYIVPKFVGNKEQRNYIIAGLISRHAPIDNESGDIGNGGFCTWVLIRKKERPGIWRDFLNLLKA